MLCYHRIDSKVDNPPNASIDQPTVPTSEWLSDDKRTAYINPNYQKYERVAMYAERKMLYVVNNLTSPLFRKATAERGFRKDSVSQYV